MKKFNYRAYLRSAARKIWLWSPDRKQAIKNAQVEPNVVVCKLCRKRMAKQAPKGQRVQYRVDHIIPASEPAALIKSWDDFFERLFECGVEGQQILCKACHDQKTRKENAVRKQTKRKAKR